MWYFCDLILTDTDTDWQFYHVIISQNIYKCINGEIIRRTQLYEWLGPSLVISLTNHFFQTMMSWQENPFLITDSNSSPLLAPKYWLAPDIGPVMENYGVFFVLNL